MTNAYVVLGGLRISAGCAVSQHDGVPRRCRSTAAAESKHVIVEPLKPGRHVGACERALTQRTNYGQDVTPGCEPEHISNWNRSAGRHVVDNSTQLRS